MKAMGKQVYDSDLQLVRLPIPRNAVLCLLQTTCGWDNNGFVPFLFGTKDVFYYRLSPGSPPQGGECVPINATALNNSVRVKNSNSAQDNLFHFHSMVYLTLRTRSNWFDSYPLLSF